VTEEDCRKWPREVCTVTRERKQKFNPVTKCEKVPQQLCGPSGCGFVQGPEICHDETKTVVTDIPNEVCNLQPQRSCKYQQPTSYLSKCPGLGRFRGKFSNSKAFVFVLA